MKKSYAITISIIITLFFFISINEEKDLEKTKLIRVIDGDTIEIEKGRIIRLANINSPEKGSFNYEGSIKLLNELLNKSIDIEYISLDNTGEREVSRVYYNGIYVNLALVEKGLSPKAWVTSGEEKIFIKAEQNAINEERGIWEHSKFYGCIISKIDQFKEEIILFNNCSDFDLNGLLIKDESRRVFEINISSNIIYLVSGENDFIKENTIKISKDNIWNNDLDTLYIFDKKGKIVHYHPYGYD
jgi:endonuclease YncB( thermonuclease family)